MGNPKNTLNTEDNSLPSNFYNNIKMTAPDGSVMCFLNKKRANWYLNRDLAEIVSQNPLTIRLKFTPAGNGKCKDPYYLTAVENRCVVCGAKDELTKHHVIPYCYRQFFPKEYKDHSSHDVNLLCRDCHNTYEEIADKKKAEIAKFYNSPLKVKAVRLDRRRLRIKKAAVAYATSKNLPKERKEELLNILREFFKREVISKADIDKAKDIDVFFRGYKGINHGEDVVKKLADINKFVVEWRVHFVENMRPKYLPQFWDINKNEKSEKSKRK